MSEIRQESSELMRRIAALEQRQREREMDDIRQRIERLEVTIAAKQSGSTKQECE